MYSLNWSRNGVASQKLGTFCKYYAKMSLASYGLSIYTSEVDDHGIDFVAETKKGFLKFQVKAIRNNTKYAFMLKEYLNITDSYLYLILILLKDGEHPKLYIIPASAWSKTGNNTKSKLFVYHSYSRPEYGINISAKNMTELKQYIFENLLNSLL